MDLNIRIAGEAGQGVQSAGKLLAGALAGLGRHVLATQSYMSRIRGGLNWLDIRLADQPLFAGRQTADLLVALTSPAREILSHQVVANGIILFNGPAGEGFLGIDLADQARKVVGEDIMANTIAVGAVFAILGYDVEQFCQYLQQQFQAKGTETVEKNLTCARLGAQLAHANGRKLKAPSVGQAPRSLVSGAEAIGLSACQAGVKFATAYPMTPSTATFSHLAACAEEYGLVVEQAEDEIAAIHMVCGAAYAGLAAMTTTSGGGFALMAEGLSLAGMMELPVLVVLAQRPGPATGLPTRTAQQDLRFALHAGHGEFPRAIYAPGTVQQCYHLTRRALETAHQYQSPVILLTDQFLQDMESNFEFPQSDPVPIDRGITVQAGEEYHRYAVTESGVSPRAIPGGRAFVVCDSDEHTDAGHITEDLQVRQVQQDKRMRKLRGMTAEALPPEHYGPRHAETILVTWGS